MQNVVQKMLQSPRNWRNLLNHSAAAGRLI